MVYFFILRNITVLIVIYIINTLLYKMWPFRIFLHKMSKLGDRAIYRQTSPNYLIRY